MGAQPSKSTSSSSEHVFSSDTPVRFSPDLINALQASPESDKTRAADLESHIQARVQAELKRIETETDKAIKDVEETISKNTSDKSNNSSEPGPLDQPFHAESPSTASLSRSSVQKEIDTLKHKLEARKFRDDAVGDNSKEVERVRDKVVSCLRLNDRRPLDCWREVDEFKREVGRLEGRFLGKVLE